MTLSRRQFTQGLGAGILLLPFLRRQARAAALPIRRVIVMTSLGIPKPIIWTPHSAPGSPVMLQDAYAPLQAVISDIALVDGLSFDEGTTNHGHSQTLTGKTDANGNPNADSVDEYIAKRIQGGVVPKLLLGWKAKNNPHFFAGGQKAKMYDDPLEAFNYAFAGTAPTMTSMPNNFPRKNILDLVSARIKSLQMNVGSDARIRLQQHLSSIETTQRSLMGITSTPPGGVACSATAPNAIPSDDPSMELIAAAQANIIVSALSCGVTRVIGMQWGITDDQRMSAGGGSQIFFQEHDKQHGYQGDTELALTISAEKFIAQWFANLIASLKKTADPLNPGTTLLDNTLILWTRDFGWAPNHAAYDIPTILTGGSGYLKKSPAGIYVNCGGQDIGPISKPYPGDPPLLKVRGKNHARILLNLCDFMGVSDYSGLGNFANDGSTERLPLTDIKM